MVDLVKKSPSTILNNMSSQSPFQSPFQDFNTATTATTATTVTHTNVFGRALLGKNQSGASDYMSAFRTKKSRQKQNTKKQRDAKGLAPNKLKKKRKRKLCTRDRLRRRMKTASIVRVSDSSRRTVTGGSN